MLQKPVKDKTLIKIDLHIGTIMGASTKNNGRSSGNGARNIENISLGGLLSSILGGNGKNQNGERFNIGSILKTLRGKSDGNG